MNLLIFCHEFIPIGGGASNALYYLSREWIKSGHKVLVVTSHHGRLPEKEIIDGIQVVRLKVGRKRVFRGHTHEMLFFILKSLGLADKLYREFKPNLSVSFMTLPGGVISLYLFYKYKLPFVTEVRGADVPGFNPKSLGFHHFFLTPFIHWIWSASKKIITNSQGLAKMARQSAPHREIFVYPNGVDSEKFRPGVLRGGSRNPKKLLFVGRFEESQKNITLLISAMRELEGVELCLVGDGKEKEYLLKIAEKFEVNKQIYFMGWLKEKELIQLYQEADIFVSASNWEGMPNTALEAMACGLPLVLSNIAGHEELVRKELNGFLFEARNEAEYIKKIKFLIENPTKTQEMGRQSRQLAITHYEWKEIAAKRLRIYEEALAML